MLSSTTKQFSNIFKIRNITIPEYEDQIKNDIHTNPIQSTIPNSMRHDLYSIINDTDYIENTDHQTIDKETTISWLTQIYYAVENRKLSTIESIYKHYRKEIKDPQNINLSIHHSFIFAFGKLGDIQKMLHLYQEIQSFITTDILTTILNCLCLHSRFIQVFEIFDEHLNNEFKPNIDNFSMIFKACVTKKDYILCEKYFQSLLNHNLHPNSLCFRYILQCCSVCRPPKYEQCLNIWQSMDKEYNIQPTAIHISFVITCLSIPYKYYPNMNYVNIPLQTYEEIYRHILYHQPIGYSSAIHPKLSRYDLQECLNIFYEYLQPMKDGVKEQLPNEELFSAIFFACEQAEDLSTALDIQQYWKKEYPNIRPQSISFSKLLGICSAIHSWKDCHRLYCDSCMLKSDMLSYDSIELQAYHKILPTISVFNQMLKCVHRELSFKIFYNMTFDVECNEENDNLTLENILENRIKFIESEMKRNQTNPTELTWVFLLECSTITQSKEFLSKILEQLVKYYLCHMRDIKKKDILYQKIDGNDIFMNIKYIECRFRLFSKIIDALFFTHQIQYALEFYHEYYKNKQLFTHWYSMKGSVDDYSSVVCLDFHSYTPALAAVAIRYVFEYEIGDWKEMEEDCNGENELQLQILTGRGTGSQSGIAMLQPWLIAYLKNEFEPSINVYIHPKNQAVIILDHIAIQNACLQSRAK